MAFLQVRTGTRPAAVRCLMLLLPLTVFAAGCATTDAAKLAAAPPTGQPCQVVATWKSAVEYYPDRVNNGRPTPALSGRVYLIDNHTGLPVVADGGLVVSVYDDHPRTGPNGDPLPLQIWHITPECMKLIQSRDPFGWGYTVNLPWDTYRPDIGQVRYLVRFDPPKDAKDPMPLYVDSGAVALQNNGGNAQAIAQATSRYSAPGFQPSAVQAPSVLAATGPQQTQPFGANAAPPPLQFNPGSSQPVQPVNATAVPNVTPTNVRLPQVNIPLNTAPAPAAPPVNPSPAVAPPLSTVINPAQYQVGATAVPAPPPAPAQPPMNTTVEVPAGVGSASAPQGVPPPTGAGQPGAMPFGPYNMPLH
jgi:hypothetical protein